MKRLLYVGGGNYPYLEAGKIYTQLDRRGNVALKEVSGLFKPYCFVKDMGNKLRYIGGLDTPYLKIGEIYTPLYQRGPLTLKEVSGLFDESAFVEVDAIQIFEKMFKDLPNFSSQMNVANCADSACTDLSIAELLCNNALQLAREEKPDYQVPDSLFHPYN